MPAATKQYDNTQLQPGLSLVSLGATVREDLSCGGCGRWPYPHTPMIMKVSFAEVR